MTFFEEGIEENPKPNVILPIGFQKGWGNAFNIQHGPYIGTYMHMRLQGLAFIPDDTVKGAVAFGPFPKSPKPRFIYEAAIDPIALLLGAHSSIYIRLTLPDPPPIEVLAEQIREQVEGMGAEERRRALDRVKSLSDSLQILARELER